MHETRFCLLHKLESGITHKMLDKLASFSAKSSLRGKRFRRRFLPVQGIYRFFVGRKLGRAQEMEGLCTRLDFRAAKKRKCLEH